MAAQQTYDIINYLVRMTASPFIQQRLLGRYLLSDGTWTSNSVNLTDLDDYCLAHIFKFLNFRDLVHCRHVCRRLHHSISEYFDTRRHFIFTCHLNGTTMKNGQNFNLAAFDFALRHMPNLRSLAFEKCSTMKSALATCPNNLFSYLSDNLYDLKMLQISRSLGITSEAISAFLTNFPELSHLQITIYNEDLLSIIVDSLKQLKYLNLDESILYDYAPLLERLPATIRTFIAPSDLSNQKMAIIDALAKGNGKNLERLEMKVKIHDLLGDSEFFDKIGVTLKRLKWFQCEIGRSMSNTETTQNVPSQGNSPSNSSGCYSISSSLELNQSSMMTPICSLHYEHRHVSVIRGLSGLRNLRVLILKEVDYFDSQDRCTILDDDSLLEIFRSCRRLEMLTISCALRRNKRNYNVCEFDSSANAKEVNHLLRQIFGDTVSEKKTTINSTPPRKRSASGVDFLANRKVLLGNPKLIDRSESFFGDLFENEPENEAIAIDDELNETGQYPHTVSDSCLDSIDLHLPRLRVLQLRGVRLGQKSFEAIANLRRLECLRLDSITFNTNELNASEHFTEFMSHMAIGNLKNKTNIRITNIPLT